MEEEEEKEEEMEHLLPYEPDQVPSMAVAAREQTERQHGYLQFPGLVR